MNIVYVLLAIGISTRPGNTDITPRITAYKSIEKCENSLLGIKSQMTASGKYKDVVAFCFARKVRK